MNEPQPIESLVNKIDESFIAFDDNLDTVNVPKAIICLTEKFGQIALAITPTGLPGRDATGGSITSLTEAVMGITAGLVRVAESIESLAAAVSERS